MYFDDYPRKYWEHVKNLGVLIENDLTWAEEVTGTIVTGCLSMYSTFEAFCVLCTRRTAVCVRWL